MLIHVANPIYDTVFKYLLEDERIAKTLLSALLKKEVVDVKVRRHEYSNGMRDKISMFRIDFAAQVRDVNGDVRLILIELQKTWLETETLRFRQYLGAHYSNPENIMREDNPSGYAIPMVTVYLLGHRVGDIRESIVYVSHKAYNYDGDEVTKGMPDPFIESLVHDSIIVQIPLLHGRVNNRLEKVLSVFDQSQKDKHNRQILNVEDDLYKGDEEMQHILRRLLAAASDSKLRQDMNVEDEYYLAIENRDTAIMAKEKENKELKTQLSEMDAQLTEKDSLLRSMTRGLLKGGMTIEAVAEMTGKSVDEVRKFLRE